MGSGYSILVWDGYGAGLVRINPRLHVEGEDMYGNPCNWWPCDDGANEEELLSRHSLDGAHACIVW